MANDTQSAITQTADFLRKSLRLIVITNHIAKINDRYRPKADIHGSMKSFRANAIPPIKIQISDTFLIQEP